MKSENQPEANFDPLLPTALKHQQLEFTAYIRDPDNNSAPAEIEDRRMAIYRELFYNNIEGFISGNFPVIRKLFDDAQWHKLVRGFYSNYRGQTPLFPEIPQEFISYLEQVNPCPDKPFLRELAHYEWIELALEIDSTTIDNEKINPDGDLIQGVPVLSPQAWLLSYHWPVDKISPQQQPTTTPEQPTFILVHRDSEYSVNFTRLNQVSARLLELLGSSKDLSGNECLEKISQELGRQGDPLIFDTGKNLLQNFRQQQIILGTTVP